MTEADTCRKFVVPRLQAAGWDTPPHLINEQRTFTDGRILFTGGKARRGRQKRADYLLRYRPDFPIAVVEAKAAYRQAGDGLQQAKEYAEILGLKFAYATNGAEIIEFDYTSGVERDQSIRLRRRGLDGSPIHCHRRVSVLYMISIERCGGNHGNWLGVREQSHPGGAHSR